jgi:hypothetical protein
MVYNLVKRDERGFKMKGDRSTYLTKKFIVLMAVTCFSIFPSVMIFGKIEFIIYGVLFFWTVKTSLEIEKIKKQNNLNIVSDLLKDKTTEEYKMIESDERVKNFISSLSQTKILYTVVVGVIITLFSVLIYYLIACIGDMLF